MDVLWTVVVDRGVDYALKYIRGGVCSRWKLIWDISVWNWVFWGFVGCDLMN